MIAGEKIIPNDPLIIVDEIQECPEALNALMYYKEKADEYHGISAPFIKYLLAQVKPYPVHRMHLLDIYPLAFDVFPEAAAPDLYAFIIGFKRRIKKPGIGSASLAFIMLNRNQ